MPWDEDALYRQFLLRDPLLNGKFLTGVVTTGIYCLPSCPARRPKRENVRFFRTPVEARETGLRPCRRCHPDAFYRGEEWHENLFERTAERVRGDVAKFKDISDLTRASGLSRTALNVLFREHGQESPAAFLRRVRAEHVRMLLRRGERPAAAAAASGYESSSAFHEQFTARSGMTPACYAALTGATHFTLKLPPKYRSREALDFYGRDPQSVSESVTPNSIRKCVLIAGRAALIEIEFRDSAGVCRTDAADTFAAHAAAVRMLGIDSDTASFERQFSNDPLLGAIVARRPGLTIPLTPAPWEALSWAIMGQQISVKAAVALRRELIGALGEKHSSGLIAHPTPERVAAIGGDALRGLKFSASKAEYLIAAARAIADGKLPLDTLRNLSARHAARLLGAVRGVGPWTVQYTFLRGLGFADCLPAGDAGLAQALERLTQSRPAEAAVREMLAAFAPYRSLASYHLWASLKGENDAI